jgi:hypothetical protein
MTTRYQFLAMLHEVLQPKTYLDIGVQNGHSLRLATSATVSIGVDPTPTPQAYAAARTVNGVVYGFTSDAFFREVDRTNGVPGVPPLLPPVDFASIDGMHLFEYVLRDFIGCERWAAPGCVVAFDDVSPYSSLIATRVQPPGDWTGDVWKIRPILDEHRPDLTTVLVDTFPTGTLLAWGLDPTSTVLRERYEAIEAEWLAAGEEVPAEILRNRGVTAGVALEMIKRREA